MTTAYRFDDDFRNMAAAKSAYAARKIGRAGDFASEKRRRDRLPRLSKAARGRLAHWNARQFVV